MSSVIQEVQNKYSFLDNLLTKFWKSWIKSNLTFKLRFKSINWMNEKAKPGCAYNPTQIEQLANVITHGVWIIPSLLCQYKLFERSNSYSQYLVSWIYGSALSLIFIISSCFHCSHYCSDHNSRYKRNFKKVIPKCLFFNTNSAIKDALHRCDRAMIYIFIAASYFPWLLLENSNNSIVLSCLEWIIWLMAASGIAYQQIFHERFKCLETCFYVLMGLGPALVVFMTGHEFRGMVQLKMGGFFYMLGIYFFKSDGVIPMAHAIWHLFVVIAAGLHYYAILVNLYPPPDFTMIKDEIS